VAASPQQATAEHVVTDLTPRLISRLSPLRWRTFARTESTAHAILFLAYVSWRGDPVGVSAFDRASSQTDKLPLRVSILEVVGFTG